MPFKDKTEQLIATAASQDRSDQADSDSAETGVERMLAASDPDSSAAVADRLSPEEHRDDGIMARAAAHDPANQDSVVDEAAQENSSEESLDNMRGTAGQGAAAGDGVDEFEEANEEEEIDWSSDDPLAEKERLDELAKQRAKHGGQGKDGLLAILDRLRAAKKETTDGATEDQLDGAIKDAVEVQEADADGDGVPDAVDSDADGDGVPDAAQSDDRFSSLREDLDRQPQTATTAPVVDLSNPPPPPPPPDYVGQGPAWAPHEGDGWGTRVKKMVDPQYRRSLSHDPTPSFQRGPAPRRGGRGGQEQRSTRRRRG